VTQIGQGRSLQSATTAKRNGRHAVVSNRHAQQEFLFKILFIKLFFINRGDGRLWQTPQGDSRDCRQRHKASEGRRIPARPRNAEFALLPVEVSATARQAGTVRYGVVGIVVRAPGQPLGSIKPERRW